MYDLPNTVAPVQPGALCVPVHDELIVCEWAAMVWVRGGCVGVGLRRVQRRERLHGLALGQPPAGWVCVAEMGRRDEGAGQLYVQGCIPRLSANISLMAEALYEVLK